MTRKKINNMYKNFTIILLAIIFLSCKEDEPSITSISLDKTELTLKVGENYQFKILHTPSDAKSPKCKWFITKYYPDYENEYGYEVATIDQNGNFTANREGETTVNIHTLDDYDPISFESYRSKCKVIILPIEAEGIKLDKNEIELNPEEKAVLNCILAPENASSKNIIWESTDTSVVKVSSEKNMPLKCEVVSFRAGEAIITAKLKDNTKISASCKVKVNAAKVENIVFQEKEKIVMQDESFKLEIIFTPKYATNKKIIWSSSDTKIATVDKDGNIKAVSFGECVIKATSEDGGYNAICRLTVKPIPVEGIMFSEYSYKVELNGEKQLNVVFTPANASNKKIKWSTSNHTIASINENGLVKGNSTGLTTITAESEDGRHKANCQIWVAEIDQFIDLFFPSASVVITNGYTTGTIYSGIINNSSKVITLTKFSIVDSKTWKTITETADESKLGNLHPGQSTSLGGRIDNIYEPIYVWEFTCNGISYHIQKQYGKADLYPSK